MLQAKPDLLRLLGDAPSMPAVDQGLAVQEVQTFVAALLPEPPLPVTLVLEAHGVNGVVTVATHANCAPAAFMPSECLAMIAHPEPLRALVARKQRDLNWRFEARVRVSRTLFMRQVVTGLSATLRGLQFRAEPPSRRTCGASTPGTRRTTETSP